MKHCKITDCNKKRIARGWCHMHYKRWQIHGSPDVLIIPQEYHGMVETPEYNIWTHMKGRCNNPKDARYADYGGRGIKVCRRWANSFAAFYNDMGKRPEGLTLERINNDKGYSPKNCKWATYQEQNENKRIYKNNELGVKGIRMTDFGNYSVRISIGNGKQKTLGTFIDLVSAKQALAEAQARLT